MKEVAGTMEIHQDKDWQIARLAIRLVLLSFIGLVWLVGTADLLFYGLVNCLIANTVGCD